MGAPLNSADWLTSLPGIAAGALAWWRSNAAVRTRVESIMHDYFDSLLADHARHVESQRQHALMLWPRPWQGGRQLTQVEEIISSTGDLMMQPLDPFDQQQQMAADAGAILDSYKPKPPEDES